ncbi:MAG: hypothetical protein CEE40_08550 [Chloroflexi bacterium B3_Chlor]|nr:MAG: hypothetical protein CEE40_08550 [Chloroflexi bacterium B3_Chlor]
MFGLIPFRWYIITPVACVLCTLILARIVMRFFSPFYGSLFTRPADRPSRLGERLAAVIRMWLVYFVTITVFTVTSGSFWYGVLVIQTASRQFTLEGARAIVLANSILIQETLLAGLFVGIVVVVIARLMTITYSDFLLRYLVFQLLVPVNVVLITMGMVLSGPGPEFYEAISDYVLKEMLPDLPVLVLFTASVAGMTTEFAVWAMHKVGRRPSRGSYPLLNAFLDGLVQGEYTISSDNVTELASSAIAYTINGDPSAEGLQSMKWFSFSGTEDVARSLRTEVRAWIAKKNHNIPVALTRRYDELMRQQGMETEQLEDISPGIGASIASVIQRITEKANLSAHPEDIRILLDQKLEHQAQATIRDRTKIITRDSVVDQLEQILGAEYNTNCHVGARRFIVLNDDTLVLTCPVPQVGHEPERFASNAGILIKDDDYIVNRYSDFFDNRWRTTSKLEDCGPAIEQLLKLNLRLVSGQRLLILVDTVKPHLIWMARVVERYACQITDSDLVAVECYKSTGSTGVEPPRGVWAAAFGETAVSQLERNGLLHKLLEKKVITEQETVILRNIISENASDIVDVVLSLAWFSISHTNFRQELCDFGKSRFASMPRLIPAVVRRCKDANYTVIAERSNKAAEWLTKAASAHLSAPNGTQLTFNLENRRAIADTGLIDNPGAFGNIPGGEAYIAPVEDGVTGVLVFECAPNRRLATPMRLTITNGKVTAVRGDRKYRAFLLRKFKEHPNNNQVAELGVGTNEKATDPINIRESEKILGTVHLGLGDNHRFGGASQAPFHEDFVVPRPTLTLTMSDDTRERLVTDGRFSSEL